MSEISKEDKKPQREIEKLCPHLDELVDSIEHLSQMMKRLESRQYLQVFSNPVRFFFYSFLHGIFIALGSTVGVLIVLGIITYILRQLQFFPGVGDIIDFLQQFNKSF